jgi:hypothetical protein
MITASDNKEYLGLTISQTTTKMKFIISRTGYASPKKEGHHHLSGEINPDR